MVTYRRKSWRNEMAVRVDVNGVLDTLIGDTGLAGSDIEAMGARIAEIHADFEARRAEIAAFRLPYDKKGVQAIQDLAREVRGEFDTLVVLAGGSSAPGIRALYGSLCPPFHAARPGSIERGARLFVVDNVDPATLAAILDEVDIHKAAFHVVSRSGESAETMSQFLVVRERLLKVLGAIDYAHRVIITTDAESGALRQIVNDEGFRSLAIPAGASGQFSVLSAAGLFPAAVAGVDINAVLAGAANMEERCRAASLLENPAYLHAVAHYLAHTRKGKNVQIVMPYGDSLEGLAQWFSHLTSESLGQAHDLDGRPVSSAQTTAVALGARDQHSRLQLYLEGPDDRIVTFFRVEDHGPRLDVPAGYGDLDAVGYLGGRTLGELLNLEHRATELALARAGRMSTTIQIPAVNGYTVGQLIQLLEMQVLTTAALRRVDPFRQSGIEEGRKLTWALAGRKGLEEVRSELQAWMQRKSPRFVI